MIPHVQIRANYDRLSSFYGLLALGEKRFAFTALKLLDFYSGNRILDIGCGTGNAFRLMKNLGLRITGLDLSHKMLIQAKNSGISPKLDLCQGDALYLPFRSATFDTIFMSFTLEVNAGGEIPIILTECQRLLKISGSLIIVTLARETSRAVRLYDWLHNTWPKVIDCRPIDIRSILGKKGYSIDKWIRRHMWGLPVDIVRAKQINKE